MARLMSIAALRFLLVPDASAARRVRRLIAERSARSGVVVGTSVELLEWARRAYLLPEPADDWGTALAETLGALGDAFWAESFRVAPAETAATVERALLDVLSATDPARAFSADGVDRLAERPRRHILDLSRLVRALSGRLPPELESIRALLAADVAQALRPIRVISIAGVPALSRWQSALVEKLNRDAGAPNSSDAELADLLSAVLVPTGRRAPGALGVLQARLFEPAAEKAVLDDTVQWVGVRDFLQEADVAAGMVQRMLEEEASLTPAEIGLLVPDRFEYALAVEDAFRLGGFALAGLPVERWRRDLGREAVFHFLYCRQKPSPAMALAVVLSSPLMPWSREDGALLAQAVVGGAYELRPPATASDEARAMLDLLREGDSEPDTLVAALGRFGALLDGGEEFAEHVLVARAAIESLQAKLVDARQLEWTTLRRAVLPRLVTSGAATEFTREGVTVWRESQEPWRAVKRLIVLGFSQGHFPVPLASNPVFSAQDLASLREAMAWPVVLPAEELTRRRARFRRQLAAVTGEVTFLVPRRNFAGEPQGSSESLVFMHQLFDGPAEAEELVLELDAAADRSQVRHLALATAGQAAPERVIEVADLEFGRDLLMLRKDREGRPKPESPSSLERLMVSGLAWLLNGLGAEPLEWAPEKADPLKLGSLAHEVFEGLFAQGRPLPAREEIPARVETLVEEALTRLAPFLRGPQWRVERRNFTALTTKAALAWRHAIEQLGAQVLAEEEWLEGEWSGIRIHGQTDLILGLPGQRLLVVDYKRSKSTKRRRQMEKGFDSQASLYRAMIETGGPKNPKATELAARLKSAVETGVVYYLLNDQTVLSDASFPETAAVPGWRAFENDIASAALGRIATRIGEVRTGVLRLNRMGDRDYFRNKAGVTPYALDKSPLIGLFSLPDEEGDEEADA